MPPPRPSPSTVELPRGILIALCAALGVALMAVAFLLGRATARPSPEPAAASFSQSEPATALDPVGEAAPLPVPAPTAEPTAPAARGERPAAAPPVDPNERAAVVRYFAQLDQIEAAGKTWADPQQFALQLVQQSAQGDRRGLEELLATERQARETLRALSVPPACREHHAEALALMDEAIGLLARLGQVIASQDLSGLSAFTAAGHELETRTKRLDVLGASLKRQYGIAVP